MGLQIYKPNKGNTGGAAHFSFNSKGDRKCVFVEFVKQNGWDAAARDGQGNGIFKDGKKAIIKLSTSEVGAFIFALENSTDAPQFFHKTKDGSTTINFKRFKGKVKDTKTQKWVDGTEYTGWGLSASKSAEDRYAISLTFGEATELREWLKNALRHIFDGIYSDDLKKAKEYASRKESQESKAEKPKSPKDFMKQEPEPTPETVVSESEDDGIPF